MKTSRAISLLSFVLVLGGCEARDRARSDSLLAAKEEQLQLTTELSAQKDSLARIIVDADDFIMQIDSQIRTVKGLPASKRATRKAESPIEEQLERRKEVLARVDALVKRAKSTATQLAASRERESALKGEKESLEKELGETRQKLADTETRLTDDHTLIADLSATIERQAARIAELELRTDSLVAESRVIADRHYRAYYVVGTEDELVGKGIVQREGGANLLIAYPGRTLQPARTLDPTMFTPIDQRAVREIPLDSTARYRVVSRQNLDQATVRERDKASFTGPLQIADPEKFWAGSRFLILVQR
jgi:hypothetical protein